MLETKYQHANWKELYFPKVQKGLDGKSEQRTRTRNRECNFVIEFRIAPKCHLLRSATRTYYVRVLRLSPMRGAGGVKNNDELSTIFPLPLLLHQTGRSEKKTSVSMQQRSMQI